MMRVSGVVEALGAEVALDAHLAGIGEPVGEVGEVALHDAELQLLPGADVLPLAEGVYPVGAENGDHTEVFKFTLSERQVGAARIKAACLPNFRPTPPTEMDLIKMEQDAIVATL